VEGFQQNSGTRREIAKLYLGNEMPPQRCSSYAGLTRVSVKRLAKEMDCPVKPGNDELAPTALFESWVAV
jgi:hypothetical protein